MDARRVDGVLARVDCVTALSERLGTRFFFTQDVGDLLRIERQRRVHSIARVPVDFQSRVLPEVRANIQRQQRKDETFERDRRARDQFRGTFSAVEKLPANETRVALRLLQMEGVTAASIRPGIQGVVEAMRERWAHQSWPPGRRP
jgi:hypothetical protein